MTINIENITKNFGKLEVLKGISHAFAEGKTTCILGPNGSGKSTLLKTILGLVIPNSGEVYINNQPALGKYQVRQNISYVSQIARFPENLKVIELLHFITQVRKQPANPKPLIELFEIEPFLNKSLKNLSGGTRQKVNLIGALMFDTPIVLLDEPTSGLDPVSNIKLKSLLNNMVQNGKTILLTTHMLGLAEEVSNEVVFLLDGHINFAGTLSELKNLSNQTTLENAIATILQQNLKTS